MRKELMRNLGALALTCALALGALAGCGSSQPAASGSDAGGSDAAQAAGQATEEVAGYPVTIENNGYTWTFEQAPEGVVVLDCPSAELMAALGLEDRVVAFTPADSSVDELLPEYQDAVAAMPAFDEGEMTYNVPSLEVVLSREPDLVIGTSFSFMDINAGAPESYIDAGINCYAAEGTCTETPSMDNLYTDIENIGEIFGVEDDAQALVADLQAHEDAVVEAVSGVEAVPVFVLDADFGDGTFYTTGGTAFEDCFLELAGAQNVFADLNTQYAQVSAEEVIARAPECIIVTQYTTLEDAQMAIDAMKADPLYAEVPAVVNDNFVIISGITVQPGIQSMDAVEAIAQALHPEAF